MDPAPPPLPPKARVKVLYFDAINTMAAELDELLDDVAHVDDTSDSRQMHAVQQERAHLDELFSLTTPAPSQPNSAQDKDKNMAALVGSLAQDAPDDIETFENPALDELFDDEDLDMMAREASVESSALSRPTSTAKALDSTPRIARTASDSSTPILSASGSSSPKKKLAFSKLPKPPPRPPGDGTTGGVAIVGQTPTKSRGKQNLYLTSPSSDTLSSSPSRGSACARSSFTVAAYEIDNTLRASTTSDSTTTNASTDDNSTTAPDPTSAPTSPTPTTTAPPLPATAPPAPTTMAVVPAPLPRSTRLLKNKIRPFMRRIGGRQRREHRSINELVTAMLMKACSSKHTSEGRTIDNFIVCTRESTESGTMLASNVRQFIDGMKHFLCKHQQEPVNRLVARETARLREECGEDEGAGQEDGTVAGGSEGSANGMVEVNVDAIQEVVLQRLVVKPLRTLLYRRMEEEVNARTLQSNRSAAEEGNSEPLTPLSVNMRAVAMRSQTEMGVNPRLAHSDWSPAVVCLHNMAKATLPLQKLEFMLSSVAAVHRIVERLQAQGKRIVLGADDFLPIFIYVLALSGMASCEVEAELLWGLLEPKLLTGEGGYFLTVFSSAVQVLKTYKAPLDSTSTTTATATTTPSEPLQMRRMPSISEMQSFLRVYFPGDPFGRVFKTFPIRNPTTTTEAIEMVCRRFNIRHEDYTSYKLFELREGKEYPIGPDQHPQDRKLKWPPSATDDTHRFVFRRCLL